MGTNYWCVEPDVDRVELTILGREVWIDLARELTIGEQRRVDTAGFKGMTTGGAATPGGPAQEAEITVDWKGQSFARTLAYVKDWSLADDKGNKLPITLDQIMQFKKPVYKAIEEAINVHVTRQEQVRRDPPGAPVPAGTSA